MLLFLDGIANRRGAVNENYGRELMELFTLGADRGAYTETDVREIAKALTGWTRDWIDERLGELRAGTRPAAGTRASRPCSASPAASRGRTRVELVLTHPLHPSFFVAQALELLHPGAAERRDVAPRSSSSTSRLGPPDPPGARGDPLLARVLRGPAHGQAAGRARGRHAARAGTRDRRASEWVWLSDGAGQRLYYPPDVSGWDDKRWLDTNTIRGRWDARQRRARAARRSRAPTRDAYPAETRRRRPSPRARAFWGDPRLTGETVALAARLRQPARARHRRAARPRPPARAAPERAAPADRRRPRLPDLLRTSDARLPLQGLLPRRAPARRRGAGRRGLRAIEPGMPLPAGTGLSRRSFLARIERARARRLRRRGARAARVARTGIAAARPPRRAARPCSSRSSVGRRSTRSRCSRRSATPATRRCARRSSCAGRGDPLDVSPRTRGCAGTRRVAPLRDLHAPARSRVIPAIGYDDPNQSHFTSRHYWEVGELNPVGRVGWLGRYLDRHGRADNPLQGLSLDYNARAGARGGARAGRGGRRRRRTTRSGRATSGTTRSTRRSTALRRARRGSPTARRRSSRGARGAASQTSRCRTQLAAALRQAASRHGSRRGSYPANSDFARRLAVLAEMLAHGPAAPCVALDAQRRLRHAREPGRRRCTTSSRCSPRRSPRSRPTSRRAWRAPRRSPTACWCTSGASSAGARRRTARGTDHGAAACRC